jgi:hypothetical protein
MWISVATGLYPSPSGRGFHAVNEFASPARAAHAGEPRDMVVGPDLLQPMKRLDGV